MPKEVLFEAVKRLIVLVLVFKELVEGTQAEVVLEYTALSDWIETLKYSHTYMLGIWKIDYVFTLLI